MSSSGTKKILEEALENLLARELELEKAIVDARNSLEAATAEAGIVQRAIKAQRKAIEELAKPSRSTARSKHGSRPWATREPADGTNTRAVLDVIRSWDSDQISLGVISQRSGLPTNKIRPVLGDLVHRGYIERVSDGIYREVKREP